MPRSGLSGATWEITGGGDTQTGAGVTGAAATDGTVVIEGGEATGRWMANSGTIAIGGVGFMKVGGGGGGDCGGSWGASMATSIR